MLLQSSPFEFFWPTWSQILSVFIHKPQSFGNIRYDCLEEMSVPGNFSISHKGQSLSTDKWAEFPGQFGLGPDLRGFQGGLRVHGLNGLVLLVWVCCECRSHQELVRKLEQGGCTHSRFFVNSQTLERHSCSCLFKYHFFKSQWANNETSSADIDLFFINRLVTIRSSLKIITLFRKQAVCISVHLHHSSSQFLMLGVIGIFFP